jgi:hypothetical protein
VSEGDPEDWAVVARATGDRVRELGWRQRELAAFSRVLIAGAVFFAWRVGRRACK